MKTLLIVIGVLLSCIGLASAEEKRTTLLCIGEYSNFRDKQIGIKLDSILVSISDSAINIKGTPTFSSGDDGTNYSIEMVTDIHYRFNIAGNILMQGNLNRYSGKLSLLWLKSEKMTDGLNASISADCRQATRRF